MKTYQQNKPILASIRLLKAEYPFWGYRRVWAYLRYRKGPEANKKRIYRLMKEDGLLASRSPRLKACRTRLKSTPRANRPNQIWGIDERHWPMLLGGSFLRAFEARRFVDC